MSSSSDHPTRGRVLRGAHVNVVAADLSQVTSRSSRAIVVSDEVVEFAKQEGYAAGHDSGHAQGYNEGIAAAQLHAELLAGLVQQLGQAAEALMAREATARADIEDQVVATAFQIAEVIVGHEVSQPDSRGRDAIARALQLAPEQGLVVARLNPADIAVIDATNLELGRALELVPDPSVSPGDCLVDVGACRVDARIGPALERVREVLA
jgi:flagellar assembly protein FliH